MRNQLQTFLLPEDEQAFSTQLRRADPTLYFIDERQAGLESVGVHTSLLDCDSGFAWVWRSGSEDPTESSSLWRVQVRAQSVTAMMQFLRSRSVETKLVSGQTVQTIRGGRLAACFTGKGTHAQQNLKKIAYQAIDAVTTRLVIQVNPVRRQALDKSPGLRVGEHAARWCRSEDHILIDSGTKDLYYLPGSAIEG